VDLCPSQACYISAHPLHSRFVLVPFHMIVDGNTGCILFQNLTVLSDEINPVRSKRTRRSFWSGLRRAPQTTPSLQVNRLCRHLAAQVSNS